MVKPQNSTYHNSNKPFYITTPIYYVNDVPHIGHTYTTLIADVISRWKKLNGKKTFFLTGTDEHGAKILEAAKKNNKEPKEYCDIISQEFKRAWKLLNIEYDYFIRTTDEKHINAVLYFLNALYNNNQIYKALYKGIYCIECEKFLDRDELIDERCPVHKIQPVVHSEENYFFRLSQHIQAIKKIIKEKKLEILPKERENEIIGKLELKTEDISISRQKLTWGIPTPFDNSQTVYVWIDALLNYISAIGYPDEKYKEIWPADIHFIGKDILWFHTVIWSGILNAVGIPPPKKIFAHGFFTVNGQKMSKTLGNVIRPKDLIDMFGVDPTRFLILSLFPLEQDGDINITELRFKYTSFLVNSYGNFVNRVISMVEKSLNGFIPKSELENSVVNQLNIFIDEFKIHMENIELYHALNKVINLCDFANKYFDVQAPWITVKNDFEKFKRTIYNSIAIIKVVSLLLSPFMPNISKRIFEMIDEKETLQEMMANIKDFKPKGDKIRAREILFKKIE